MMGRRVNAWIAMAFGLGLALPGSADAQVRVHVDWEWSSDGRNSGGIYVEGRYGTRYPRVGVVRYQPVRYVRVSGIRVPRGHRPARGMCRLWYPDVSPGRQPRPVRCERLRGQFHPDVLVVTWRGVLRPVWDGYDRYYYRDGRRVAYRRVDGRYDRYDGYDRDLRYDRDGRWDGDYWEDRYDDDWWGDDDDRDDDRIRGRGNRRGEVRGGRGGNGRGNSRSRGRGPGG